jgi:hypothetical protein
MGCLEEMRNAYRTLIQNPERKKPQGNHKRKWQNNIKIDVL